MRNKEIVGLISFALEKLTVTDNAKPSARFSDL